MAKPSGVSSADALQKLQAAFAASHTFAPLRDSQVARPSKGDDQVFKMGHGGTLDPLAAGVLIVGIGRGTKQLGEYLACTKTYETVVAFGASTDSYDCTGALTDRADVLAMLREAIGRNPLAGVIHAFSGDSAFAEACLQLGLHVGFAGQVTYTNRKFESLRQAATVVPDDRILIETDSPYLVPHPLRGKQKRNEPAEVIHTARCLAALRGRTLDQLAEHSSANARRLFRLP